jgi:hypothetical protein
MWKGSPFCSDGLLHGTWVNSTIFHVTSLFYIIDVQIFKGTISILFLKNGLKKMQAKL